MNRTSRRLRGRAPAGPEALLAASPPRSRPAAPAEITVTVCQLETPDGDGEGESPKDSPDIKQDLSRADSTDSEEVPLKRMKRSGQNKLKKTAAECDDSLSEGVQKTEELKEGAVNDDSTQLDGRDEPLSDAKTRKIIKVITTGGRPFFEVDKSVETIDHSSASKHSTYNSKVDANNKMLFLGSGKQLYDCEYCDDGFESESEVALHTKIEHIVAVKKRLRLNKACLICWRKFQGSLKKHILRVHLMIQDGTRVDRPMFVCERCNVIFFNKNMLIYHYNLMHLKHVYKIGKGRGECPVCQKSMMMTSVPYHTDVGHRVKSIGTCPICLVKQKDLKMMLQHVESEHEPVFKCRFCPYENRQEQLLDYHLEKSHGRKASKCDVEVSEAVAARCFTKGYIPRFVVQWVTQGLSLENVLHVCVLCQEVCEKDELVHHITSQHGHDFPPNDTGTELKPSKTPSEFKNIKSADVEMNILPKFTKHECCGEVFTSRVLLKLHNSHVHSARPADVGAAEAVVLKETEDMYEWDDKEVRLPASKCYKKNKPNDASVSKGLTEVVPEIATLVRIDPGQTVSENISVVWDSDEELVELIQIESDNESE